MFDQVTYGPLCNILFMSFATLVLEGKSLQFLSQKVSQPESLLKYIYIERERERERDMARFI